MRAPFAATAQAAYEGYRQMLQVSPLELVEDGAVFLLASRIHRLTPEEHSEEDRYAHVRLEFRDWNGRVWLECMTRLTGFAEGNPVPVQVVGLDARTRLAHHLSSHHGVCLWIDHDGSPYTTLQAFLPPESGFDEVEQIVGETVRHYDLLARRMALLPSGPPPENYLYTSDRYGEAFLPLLGELAQHLGEERAGLVEGNSPLAYRSEFPLQGATAHTFFDLTEDTSRGMQFLMFDTAFALQHRPLGKPPRSLWPPLAHTVPLLVQDFGTGVFWQAGEEPSLMLFSTNAFWLGRPTLEDYRALLDWAADKALAAQEKLFEMVRHFSS